MDNFIDWATILPKVESLRRTLHKAPEVSEYEFETRKILKKFLVDNTNVEIFDQGRWFYALKQGEIGELTVAIRADHDAIINTIGQPFHGCGHDGHSAMLAGLALVLEQCPVNNNVLFIFQHSEENGVGAKEVIDVIRDLKIDHIYGLHNFPGFIEGELLLKSDTFMCASTGMEIIFKGSQSHAGQPEKGNNPIYSMAKLIADLEPLSHFNGYKPLDWQGKHFSNLVMVTIVSTTLGEPNNYGISPAIGKLQLTLRAAKFEDLQLLMNSIKDNVEQLGMENHLTTEISFNSDFPDTTNSVEEINRLEQIFKQNNESVRYLEEAFRPSEDFGWYLKEISGSFFGLGSGIETPSLHDDDYEFPDSIIKNGVNAFYSIVANNF